MGRDDSQTLDSEPLPSTEPHLHVWDETDPDAAAYDNLETPPRPDDDGDVLEFPL